MLACEAEIAQANDISAMRSLQNEQDKANQKSLEIDKEKLSRKANSSHEYLVSDQVRALEYTENVDSTDGIQSSLTESLLNESISRALLDLEEETVSSLDSFKIQFQFPDGSRKIRSFSSKSTTKVLFHFLPL